MKKVVCFFGSYRNDYPRNLLTMKAFDELGWQIVECHDAGGGARHYISLVKQFMKKGVSTSFIFIGVLGHYDLPLAWILGKMFNKKIIFDAFYSIYDAYVLDRKEVYKISMASFRFWFYDFLAVRLADKIILDTKENVDFYTKNFKVGSEKFFVLPVSADPAIFKYQKTKKYRKLAIGFYGSFLPLHGVDMIVKSVRLLINKNIKLILLGSGPGLETIKRQVKELRLSDKVFFLPNVAYNDLPRFYRHIDLFLAGPFGKTDKAKRVLTAKTVESLSLGKPTVVTKTPATLRLLRRYQGDIIWLENVSHEGLADLVNKFYDHPLPKTMEVFSKSELSFNKFKDTLNQIITK